jgi:hypothetical protein
MPDIHYGTLNLWLVKQLTAWSWVRFEKPTDVQLLKKFLTIFGTRKFITMIKIAGHRCLSWARLIQSTSSHLISFRSILLPSHISLVISILHVYLQKSCMHFYLTYVPCTAHFILLNLLILIIFGEEYIMINFFIRLCNPFVGPWPPFQFS